MSQASNTEAVVDQDALAFAAVITHIGEHRDLAHQMPNDLGPLGIGEPRVQPAPDLDEQILWQRFWGHSFLRGLQPLQTALRLA